MENILNYLCLLVGAALIIVSVIPLPAKSKFLCDREFDNKERCEKECDFCKYWNGQKGNKLKNFRGN